MVALLQYVLPNALVDQANNISGRHEGRQPWLQQHRLELIRTENPHI